MGEFVEVVEGHFEVVPGHFEVTPGHFEVGAAHGGVPQGLVAVSNRGGGKMIR